MRCLKNFHLKWNKLTAMRIFLIIICGRVASSYTTLLDSNPYFDRVTSENFGNEVIFYGLGLNYTNLTSIIQQTVLSIMICKTIFRVVPNCLSAFAERLDNGTVLCTYTQKAVYELPTFQADQTKAFAFFKDQNATKPFQYYGGWSYLGSTGKFYIFRDYVNAVNTNGSCDRDYPNGHFLRLQTKKDLTTFYGISPLIATNYFPYLLDLSCINGSLIWGDGTEFKRTEAGSILKPNPSSSNTCDSGLSVLLWTSYEYLMYIPWNMYLACEVNPFSLP